MKKVLSIGIILAMFMVMVTGCTPNNIASLNQSAPKKGDTVATIKTDFGDIKIVLFDKVAPKAVENFTTHATNGYYNGLTFHRILTDFMIQGGDPVGNGTGGKSIWDAPFEDEFDISAMNLRGALSMANSGPNTNGSQFFIVQAGPATITQGLWDNLELSGMTIDDKVKKIYEQKGGTPWLDGVHTVFGQVFEGMEVVDKIAMTDVDPNSGVPDVPVIINTIEISKFE